MRLRTRPLIVGLVVLLCGLAPVRGVRAGAGEPAVAYYERIPYISGGVGDEELAALRAHEKDYNLHLLFATTTGAYLADVHVVITDQAGKTILEAVSQGPRFYTTLPAGQYRVTAQVRGVARQQTVQVPPNKPAHLAFSWEG